MGWYGHWKDVKGLEVALKKHWGMSSNIGKTQRFCFWAIGKHRARVVKKHQFLKVMLGKCWNNIKEHQAMLRDT
jgi:hypothetical protein